MRPSTPHVNAAFANMCIKNVYASKSCIQLAETRKETTLQICFPQAKFLNLEKKEMTLSFACSSSSSSSSRQKNMFRADSTVHCLNSFLIFSLVGGFNPLKNDGVRQLGLYDSPKKRRNMFQTTNQCIYYYTPIKSHINHM